MAFGRVAGRNMARKVRGPHDVSVSLISTRRTHHVLSELVNCGLSPFVDRGVEHNLSTNHIRSITLQLIMSERRRVHTFIPRRC